jgi:hypothetical protein
VQIGPIEGRGVVGQERPADLLQHKAPVIGVTELRNLEAQCGLNHPVDTFGWRTLYQIAKLKK